MSVNFTRYREQLQAASRSFQRIQQHDGGWGLTPTSVSSIVNTAEALVVLRAADVDNESASRGIDFLIEALPLFCQPAPTRPGAMGGRGERVRHVTFCLDGLLSYPERAFASEGLETLDWSLNWLRTAMLPDGWPETLGQRRVSIHQTARVVAALARLIILNQQWRKLSEPQIALAHLMLSRGASVLRHLQRADGSWPVRPGAEQASSPSKTSLAVMALGYYAHLASDTAVSSQRRSGARWLLAHHDSWAKSTEDDTDEQGTHWVHLAYAECVRGVIGGYPETPAQLARSWRFMSRQWSDQEFLWVEPSLSEGKATIRAAYHTVMAFECADPESRLLHPAPLEADPASHLGALLRLKIDPDRERGVIALSSKGEIRVRLSAALFRTVGALIRLDGQATAHELGTEADLSRDAVHQNIRRINTALDKVMQGRMDGRITSQRQNGVWTYRVGPDREFGW